MNLKKKFFHVIGMKKNVDELQPGTFRGFLKKKTEAKSIFSIAKLKQNFFIHTQK